MTNENQQYGDAVPATPNGASLAANNNANGHSGQANNDHSGSATPAPGNAGSGGGANANAKDRSRDLSTAKTAQSTPQNGNPNANRTIGHYVVGKFILY